MAAKEAQTETTTNTALAGIDPTTGEIVNIDDYSQYAGQGFETHTLDDYALPFLGLLQALSPILESRDDLRPGMVINTVTKDAYDGKAGVKFVPAATRHEFVEWKPRDQGGGFVASHEVSSELVRRLTSNGKTVGMLKTPDGNDLVETFYVYGLVVDDEGGYGHAVVSFESTKIKKYRAWMTKAKTIQLTVGNPPRRIPAPLFSHVYRLRTVSEKNKKGSYFNWEVGFDGASAMECRLAPNSELFQAAVKVREQIEDGTAKADYSSMSNSAGSNADDYVDGSVDETKPVF